MAKLIIRPVIDKKLSAIIRLVAIVAITLSMTMTSTSYTSLASDNEQITLNTDEMPLKDVLQKISKQAGYEVSISPPWAEVPLTLSLEKADLEEAIKKILRVLNQPSNFILYDEAQKKVAILISDSPSNIFSSGDHVITHFNPENEATMPPLSGIGGLPFGAAQTNELKRVKERYQKRIDSFTDDTVIVPPSSPGDTGLTIGGLKEVKNILEQPLPGDTVIIPPSANGGYGLTVSGLEEVKIKQKESIAQLPEPPATELPEANDVAPAIENRF
jgi:hypothetical protein